MFPKVGGAGCEATECVNIAAVRLLCVGSRTPLK